MKHKFIINNESSSLVILFAGWGMSPSIFSDIDINHDFLLIYDYNDYNFDASIISRYNNIYIFAWSFGVFATVQFLSKNENLPICFKMAINGTMTPINNQLGIPEEIFKGTLDTLSERSLVKFNRRICNSKEQYESFTAKKSERDIDSLRSELESVYNNSSTNNYHLFQWDKVIISRNDNIFPFANQLNSWTKYCNNIIEIEGGHLPYDFNNIFTDNIINKKLLKRRFSKQLSDYNNYAISQQQISEKLFRLWSKCGLKENKSILEIGCGTGFLTKLYGKSLCPSKLILNDLCKIPSSYFNDIDNYIFASGDAEQIHFGDYGKFDYIVSSSAIQWFENIKKFLREMFDILNDNGIIALSTFGIKNMNEISSITGVSLNYIDVNKIKEIIIENFDIIYFEEEENIMYFDTPLDVLRHIKSTGVNSISSNQKWTKSQLNNFTTDYVAVSGKYPLTYNPIYIVARKKNKQ